MIQTLILVSIETKTFSMENTFILGLRMSHDTMAGYSAPFNFCLEH